MVTTLLKADRDGGRGPGRRVGAAARASGRLDDTRCHYGRAGRRLDRGGRSRGDARCRRHARRVRRWIGLSQVAFAKRSGVPVDRVRNWRLPRRRRRSSSMIMARGWMAGTSLR